MDSTEIPHGKGTSFRDIADEVAQNATFPQTLTQCVPAASWVCVIGRLEQFVRNPDGPVFRVRRKAMPPLQIAGIMPDMPGEVVNRKLFNVEEFHHVVGILPETGRFELIRGEIFEMPWPESPHSGHVTRLTELFMFRLGRAVNVSVQNPLHIDEYSEVLPDIALLKRREDFYEGAHPSPPDVLLAVEVSHKSSNYDSRVKGSLYAEHEIVEYWQLDLKKECVVVRRDPADGEYRTVLTLTKGQTVSPSQLPDVAFSIDELLG